MSDAVSTPSVGEKRGRQDDTPQRAPEPEPEVEAWLNSTYEEKDAIRALGGKYFGGKQKWFVPKGMDTSPFAQWLPSNIQFLTCPFAEKDEAKALGAR